MPWKLLGGSGESGITFGALAEPRLFFTLEIARERIGNFSTEDTGIFILGYDQQAWVSSQVQLKEI